MQLPANPPLTQVQGQTIQPATGHGRQQPASVGQRQEGSGQGGAEAAGSSQGGRETVRQNPNVAEYDRNAPRGTYLNIII